MNAASVRGTVELDDSAFQHAIQRAKASLEGFGQALASQGRRSLPDLQVAMEKAAAGTRRLTEAQSQQNRFVDELARKRRVLAEAYAGEDTAAQRVAAAYGKLSNAQRAALIETDRLIDGHKRHQQALGRLKDAFPAVLAGIGGGIFAAGAGLLKVGADFDKMADTIRIGTGATGKSLAALNESARRVLAEVPTSFAEAGQAITEVSRRTGLTGAPLEAMAKRLLRLKDLTGGDLQAALRGATRALNAFGIQAKDQPAALDLLFRAGQRTGIGYQRATDALAKAGPVLRALGFDFAGATALIASFEKQGVGAERALAALNLAQQRLAKAGIKDMAGGFREMIRQIKGAGSESKAASLGLQFFGRSGAQMARLIREGKLETEALAQSLRTGTDTILKAARDTDDFAEKFLILKNNVFLALEPLGKRLFDTLDGLIPKLQRASGGIKDVGSAFGRMPGWAQDASLVVGGFVGTAALLTGLLLKLKAATDGLQAGLLGIVPGARSAGAALLSLSAPILAITALLAVGGALLTNWGGARDKFITGAAVIQGSFLALKRSIGEASAAGGGFFATMQRIGRINLGQVFQRGQQAATAPPYLRTPLLPPGSKLGYTPSQFARVNKGLPPNLPPVGGAGSPGGGRPDLSGIGKPESAAVTAQKRAAEELAERRYRLTLITKGYTEAEAQLLTQHRQAPQAIQAQLLAQIRLEEHRDAAERKAKEREAARRKAAQEKLADSNAALRSAATLHAQTLDMQRQIDAGGRRQQTAAAAVKFAKGDPAARAIYQQAQAEYDRVKQRLDNLNRLRGQLEAVEKKIRDREEKANAGRPFIGPPVPAALAADPKAQALEARLQAQQQRLAAGEAADKATAARLRADQEREMAGWNALAGALSDVETRRKELDGATRAEASLEQRLLQNIDVMNDAMLEEALRILAVSKANDELAASIKERERAALRAQQVDELLANTLTDLNAEFETLLGLQPQQTRAINRLAADTSLLTDAQREQLRQVQTMFRQRQGLVEAKRFADGFADVVNGVLTNLQGGFRGFFDGIYQGFRGLLVDMAAEFLSSQLRTVLTKTLSGLVMGGGGSGGAANPLTQLGLGALGSVGAGGTQGSNAFVGGFSGGLANAITGSLGNMSLQGPGSPLSPAAAGAGGGFTVQVNVRGQDTPAVRQNAGAAGAEIGRSIMRQTRRNG